MEHESFTITGYDPERVVQDGNRFLLANGYLGIRGTVEEADRSSLLCAAGSGQGTDNP